MSYISKPLGSISAMEFSIGGINQVALLERSRLESYSYDGIDITGLTVASGATFQNIVFVKDSCTLEQEMVKTATSHYITQKVKFSVLTDDNETSQSVLLGREYVALVRKNSGKWVLAGRDNGIACSVYTNNSTADDASRTYELTGSNLGDASNLVMSDVALAALINKG